MIQETNGNTKTNPKQMVSAKIAIIGSRTFTDYNLLALTINDIKRDRGIVNLIVISGGAAGADTLAERYSNEHGHKCIVHAANWKDLTHRDARIKSNAYGRYDANAGHRRNALIIKDADIIVAFTNGSPGTRDSIAKAARAGKEVIKIEF